MKFRQSFFGGWRVGVCELGGDGGGGVSWSTPIPRYVFTISIIMFLNKTWVIEFNLYGDTLFLVLFLEGITNLGALYNLQFLIFHFFF